MSTRVSARGRRLAVGVLSLGLVALGVACVDLFHSTDFETLCTKAPDDPLCGATDAGKPDVVVVAAEGGDSARPHPNFCAWSSAEARVQAARACAWLGACERPLGDSLFGACVVDAQLAYDCTANPSLRPRLASDDFWSCLATVQSCGDVDKCIFPAGVQECLAVPTGSSTACGTQSNGAVRLECAGPAGRAHGVEPCAMLGKICSAADDAGSVARCTGARAFKCSTSSGACAGTFAIECKPFSTGFVDQGIDCSGVGAGKCIIGDAGVACAPTPTAGTCLEDSAPICDGAVVRMCLGGQDIRIDCAKLGLDCDATGVTTVNPAAACMTRDGGGCAASDLCPTQGTLQSCGRGAVYKVDCVGAGLGTCAIDTAGHGACSPP